MTTAVAVPGALAVPEAASRADVLRGTYAGLAEALRPLVRLEAVPRVGGERVTGERLVRDAALREQLVDAAERRIADTYGVTPRRDVAAMDALHQYAFYAAVAMSGPWFLAHRVPWIGRDGFAHDGASDTLTVAPSHLLCLPGDPVAALPGVRVVADEERLRAALREAVADHLGPVLEAFRPLLRRGTRAVWGLAADELTEGIWYVGRVTGQERRAVAAADVLLPGGTPPFVGAAGFRPCGAAAAAGEGDAAGEATRTRINCCLWYTVTPQRPCSTCPRRGIS